eukprot:7387020-Prymnesium_polylepis.1
MSERRERASSAESVRRAQRVCEFCRVEDWTAASRALHEPFTSRSRAGHGDQMFGRVTPLPKFTFKSR